jgi:hypothetical protein
MRPLAPVAIAVALVLAGCGRGGGAAAPSCAAKMKRMEEILTAPHDAIVNERSLPSVEKADGLGATPGAIVIQVTSDEPPQIRVGDGPVTEWRFGGTNPDVIAEVERRLAAAPGAPIVLEVPSTVEAWGAAQLLEVLSQAAPVRIAVGEQHLDLAPDAPAGLAAELKAILAEEPGDRAAKVARIAERAAGACLPQVEAGLEKGRADRSPTGQDARIVAALIEATRDCDCATFDAIAVATVFRAILAGAKLGWIEVRSDRTSLRKVSFGRKNERWGELVKRVMEADAATRRAGIDLGPR